MNIYALFPLIATIAYLPLLATTASSRPWQKRHTLFIIYLFVAMMWSLFDYIFRANLFPDHTMLVWKITIILFPIMVVQFHNFTSSFYAPGQGRWLPFAYISLVAIIIMVLTGFIGREVVVEGEKMHPEYGPGIFVLAVPLLGLAGRNLYVLGKRLRNTYNPVLYNQMLSLFLGYCILTGGSITDLFPWFKEIPIAHFSNLVNAFILSYATIRHQLVDVRIVLRRGLAWATLGIVGAILYWLLLGLLHMVMGFQIDLPATFAATGISIFASIIVYRLRGVLFTGVIRVFQGQSYDYHRALSEFADRIHGVFSIKKQGRELLDLVIKAVNCDRACLLFPDVEADVFTAQLVEPKRKENPLGGFKLEKDNPILEYLSQEQKPLTREELSILPRFRSLWEREKEAIDDIGVEIFLPLISRDRLIAILMLGKKISGRFSLEDLSLLNDVADRVAVSMEKEYLREQLREREEQLSVINRSSAILTSSLDIQGIYDSFIEELKRVVDVDWACITLIEESNIYVLALFSRGTSHWKVGDRIPIAGTATEHLYNNKETVYEPDMAEGCRFNTGRHHQQSDIRSIAYIPLIVKSEVIGTLIVASKQPEAYDQRQLTLLENLAAQIAMPVENARLYARVEERSRVDELTGLLNRRSLDEMIDAEIGRHSRYGGIFTLIILDLDSFKSFNDNYGHLAGDKLLKQIGGIIKGAIRGVDRAFRYGGDEFAIFCPQTAIDAAKKVGERVRKQIALKVKAGYVPVTASLGLASWPADGISGNEIIAAADTALYQAKRGGGNQSHCASGMMLPVDDIMFSLEGNQNDESLSTIYALVNTVDARDSYSHNHSRKASDCALTLAKAIGLGQEETNRLENCALLHDIGKIGISDEILSKREKLTDEEWAMVRMHPQLGATIIGRVRQLNPCVAGVLHHHERYDGSGYPKGLKGEAIPLEARILAIADAFAAMTTERPYSGPLSVEEALEEIKKGAGKQFDPHLVEAFVVAKSTASLSE